MTSSKASVEVDRTCKRAMSNVNNGQVGRLNDLLVDAEQTPLAMVNAENDIVAAIYQSYPISLPRVERHTSPTDPEHCY
jgi:hypothetical protein